MPQNPKGLCWDSPRRASQRLPAVPYQPLPLQAPPDGLDLLAWSIWFGWIVRDLEGTRLESWWQRSLGRRNVDGLCLGSSCPEQPGPTVKPSLLLATTQNKQLWGPLQEMMHSNPQMRNMLTPKSKEPLEKGRQTPWMATQQAFPSFTISQNWFKLMTSQWCHPTILSSAIPFSSCLQSFPASGSFPRSRLFA